MMDTPELMPCPFCGDKMEENKGLGIVHNKQGRCIIGVMGFINTTAWNTRSSIIPAMIAEAVALERERIAMMIERVPLYDVFGNRLERTIAAKICKDE